MKWCPLDAPANSPTNLKLIFKYMQDSLALKEFPVMEPFTWYARHLDLFMAHQQKTNVCLQAHLKNGMDSDVILLVLSSIVYQEEKVTYLSHRLPGRDLGRAEWSLTWTQTAGSNPAERGKFHNYWVSLRKRREAACHGASSNAHTEYVYKEGTTEPLQNSIPFLFNTVAIMN